MFGGTCSLGWAALEAFFTSRVQGVSLILMRVGKLSLDFARTVKPRLAVVDPLPPNCIQGKVAVPLIHLKCRQQTFS